MSQFMTYRGHVKQGVIVLDHSVQLPEGAAVEVYASEPPPLQGTWDQIERQDDEVIVAGSVGAAMSLSRPEDFSDWER